MQPWLGKQTNGVSNEVFAGELVCSGLPVIVRSRPSIFSDFNLRNASLIMTQRTTTNRYVSFVSMFDMVLHC